MKITVMMLSDDRILSLDVEPEEPAENVKALLEVETGVPLANQQLLHNSRELPNSASLRSSGVREGDLLMMQVAGPSPGPGSGSGLGSGSGSGSASGPSQGLASNFSLHPDGSAVDPRALQQQLRSNPNVIGQLLSTNPEFAQAIMGDDVEKFQHFLREQHRQKLEIQRRQQEEISLLNADPFDFEAQRRIEDLIRQRNIDENWEAAIEHNPEAFARVIMLYVDMEVNGVPLKAFVDSGAQMTIISKSCAERCGLLRLLDKRYIGIAKGVGQSEIVGRIHVAHIKIGGKFFMCSFTVLDQPDMEFIFGLDMLRKHQCSIDLKDNVLRVGGGEIAVPFLQEKDLPEHVKEERETLPKVQGGSTSTSNTPSLPNVTGTNSPVRSSLSSANTIPHDLEAKVERLMQLGFDRQTCLKALQLFNGNEDQAASYLFGG